MLPGRPPADVAAADWLCGCQPVTPARPAEPPAVLSARWPAEPPATYRTARSATSPAAAARAAEPPDQPASAPRRLGLLAYQ
jgi:hypothetical protein